MSCKDSESKMNIVGYLKVVRHGTTSHGDVDILFIEQVSLVDAAVKVLWTLMWCQRYWIVGLHDCKVIVPFIRKSDSQERNSKGWRLISPREGWKLRLAQGKTWKDKLCHQTKYHKTTVLWSYLNELSVKDSLNGKFNGIYWNHWSCWGELV